MRLEWIDPPTPARRGGARAVGAGELSGDDGVAGGGEPSLAGHGNGLVADLGAREELCRHGRPKSVARVVVGTGEEDDEEVLAQRLWLRVTDDRVVGRLRQLPP